MVFYQGLAISPLELAVDRKRSINRGVFVSKPVLHDNRSVTYFANDVQIVTGDHDRGGLAKLNSAISGFSV